MGRPFGVETERWHLHRPSVARRRARTGQSPDPRAADTRPVGPRAAASRWRRGAARGSSVPGDRSPAVPAGEGRAAVDTATRSAPAGRWIAEAVRAATPDTVAALVPAQI